jgi:NAD(P)-dependent dehydrogenase (short-subunit alcohol dehydrogenase family)
MKNWVFRQRTETDAMSEYYENKVAVVTGAASGIGLALSELLLSFGAKAVVLNAEKLEKERERLDALRPGKVLGCQTDVTKQQSVAAMIRSAAEFGAGQIHFLFNNAGARGRISSVTRADRVDQTLCHPGSFGIDTRWEVLFKSSRLGRRCDVESSTACPT